MGAGQRTVVVGAGSVGLAAARLLAQRGAEVVVLESAPAPGGTWSSFEAAAGLRFDRGIRLGMSTGDARLDRAVYGSLDMEWTKLEGFAREGHVLRGQLSTTNQCPDARLFGPRVTNRALLEMHRASDGARPVNLAQTLTQKFGETLTNAIYRPFFRKVTGVELEALSPDADRYYVPSRVTITDRGQTERHMRESSRLRARLAHPSSRGLPAPGRAFYYPAHGAMGGWIQAAANDLERQSNVQIHYGANVERLVREGGRVSGVELSDGRLIGCDGVFWSRPAVTLAKAAKMVVPAVRPVFRDLAVVHLVADHEPATDVMFAPFYDESSTIHRAFFYREVRANASKLERRAMTCEVVLAPDAELDQSELARRVLCELREAGLMPRDAWLERAWVERFPKTFPVPTPELADAERAVRASLAELENVAVVSRTPQTPFLESLLRATDREVSRLLGCAPVARAA
ncbi:MAG: NAD(P)/FAD-dependent oxidoreductase [Sandaracinaceae bacterium]